MELDKFCQSCMLPKKNELFEKKQKKMEQKYKLLQTMICKWRIYKSGIKNCQRHARI